MTLIGLEQSDTDFKRMMMMASLLSVAYIFQVSKFYFNRRSYRQNKKFAVPSTEFWPRNPADCVLVDCSGSLTLAIDPHKKTF